MHVIIPPCLMVDTDHHIKLMFPTKPWDTLDGYIRLNELLTDRFPWSKIEWKGESVYLHKPSAG